jgi:hypothetical protein
MQPERYECSAFSTDLRQGQHAEPERYLAAFFIGLEAEPIGLVQSNLKGVQEIHALHHPRSIGTRPSALRRAEQIGSYGVCSIAPAMSCAARSRRRDWSVGSR